MDEYDNMHTGEELACPFPNQQSCLQHLDRFGKMLVSALVMAGGAVVMLLYAEGRHADENIRLFLVEIADHYMKVCLHSGVVRPTAVGV